MLLMTKKSNPTWNTVWEPQIILVSHWTCVCHCLNAVPYDDSRPKYLRLNSLLLDEICWVPLGYHHIQLQNLIKTQSFPTILEPSHIGTNDTVLNKTKIIWKYMVVLIMMRVVKPGLKLVACGSRFNYWEGWYLRRHKIEYKNRSIQGKRYKVHWRRSSSVK